MATPKTAKIEAGNASDSVASANGWLVEWVLFQVRLPGESAQPAGILLIDPRPDRLYLELRDLVFDEGDQDVAEVWQELAQDLRRKGQEFGGAFILNWLESDASNVFQIGSRREVWTDNPEQMVIQLYSEYVLSSSKSERRHARSERLRFSQDQIQSAEKTVGVLPSSVIAILAVLNDPDSHSVQIEQALNRDPILAAHIMRVANLALYELSQPVRTLNAAIQRLGSEAVKFQVLGLSIKNVFSAPWLKEIWNHSITAAQVARQLAREKRLANNEAALLGLLHDIGQIVLHGLGDAYRQELRLERDRGSYLVQAERTICGESHAEIGANLLQTWAFPADMVDSVRHHHDPSQSSSRTTALLYLAEAYLESDEDVYDPSLHAEMLRKLELGSGRLSRGLTRLDPDLSILRFTAAA